LTLNVIASSTPTSAKATLSPIRACAQAVCTYADGRITREIVVLELHNDYPITIRQAHQLAVALMDLTRAAVIAAELDGEAGGVRNPV
jgi:hypothetical protein